LPASGKTVDSIEEVAGLYHAHRQVPQRSDEKQGGGATREAARTTLGEAQWWQRGPCDQVQEPEAVVSPAQFLSENFGAFKKKDQWGKRLDELWTARRSDSSMFGRGDRVRLPTLPNGADYLSVRYIS